MGTCPWNLYSSAVKDGFASDFPVLRVFSQILVAYSSVLIYMDGFPKLTHCLGAPHKVTTPPAELQAAP